MCIACQKQVSLFEWQQHPEHIQLHVLQLIVAIRNMCWSLFVGKKSALHIQQ